MVYSSLHKELEQVIELGLHINGTPGEQAVIRGSLCRLWTDLFVDPSAFKILMHGCDKIIWNDSLDRIKELVLGLNDFLVEIANLVTANQKIDYGDIRGRLSWLVNFLGRDVTSFVQTARIRTVVHAGSTSVIPLYVTLDWFHLFHLNDYDSEYVTALNMFADFAYMEIPMTELESALQVS